MATKAGYYDAEGDLVNNTPSINVHDGDLPYPIGFLHVYEIEGLEEPKEVVPKEPKCARFNRHILCSKHWLCECSCFDEA